MMLALDAEPARPVVEPAAVVLTSVGRFSHPVLVAAPPGDARRLVVVEQEGTVRLVVDGAVHDAPFLDLSDEVHVGAEDGLLGLAFAPDFASSGLVYVLFTRRDGHVRLVEYRRSELDPDRVDPASARHVLTVEKRRPTHNGGMLQFGPDGLLYVGIGDGGEPLAARDPRRPLGKILRLDPRSNAPPEIWASGLRNPWRFWIDPEGGDAYIGDVGEELREEIDHVPAGGSGLDFGWPCYEGRLRVAAGACASATPPAYDYAHGRRRCAIIGGVVMRDRRLPSLDGAFLFADACGASIRTLRLGGAPSSVAARTGKLRLRIANPVSFGVDGAGRAYVTSFLGPVYRLDPAGGA